MADRVLFISWGEAVRGREARGLEVFNEAMGMLGRMQQPLRFCQWPATRHSPTPRGRSRSSAWFGAPPS
jgi:hypothetical protein